MLVIMEGHAEDYKFSNKIGIGGFGAVYKALNVVNHTYVAIKKIRIAVNEERNQFENEKSVHKICKHNSILNLISYFTDAEKKYGYLVLELCNKGSLESFLKKSQSYLEEKEAFHIILGIVEGIVFLHKKNIIHRDLKLANILLDDTFHPKICDFGLAKRFYKDGGNKTICGTGNFMSPEIIKRQFYGTETDIWSLGIIIHSMLTGSLPFDGNSLKEISENVVTKDFSLRCLHNKSISKEAIDLVTKCLEKDPAKRIKTSDLLNHKFFSQSRKGRHCSPDSGRFTCSSVGSSLAPISTQKHRQQMHGARSHLIDSMSNLPSNHQAHIPQIKSNLNSNTKLVMNSRERPEFYKPPHLYIKKQQDNLSIERSQYEKSLGNQSRNLNPRNRVRGSSNPPPLDRLNSDKRYDAQRPVSDMDMPRHYRRNMQLQNLTNDEWSIRPSTTISPSQRSRERSGDRRARKVSAEANYDTQGSNDRLPRMPSDEMALPTCGSLQKQSPHARPSSTHSQESSDKKGSAGRRKLMGPFCTRRLEPFEKKYPTKTFCLLADGSVRLSKSGVTSIEEAMIISFDGMDIYICRRKNLSACITSNIEEFLSNCEQVRYSHKNLPFSHFERYNTIVQLIEAIKSATHKVTQHTELATCILMETLEHFMAKFYSGETIVLNPEGNKIIFENGNQQKLYSSRNLREYERSLYEHAKEVKEDCLQLEQINSKHENNSHRPVFPLISGKRKPVGSRRKPLRNLKKEKETTCNKENVSPPLPQTTFESLNINCKSDSTRSKKSTRSRTPLGVSGIDNVQNNLDFKIFRGNEYIELRFTDSSLIRGKCDSGSITYLHFDGQENILDNKYLTNVRLDTPMGYKVKCFQNIFTKR